MRYDIWKGIKKDWAKAGLEPGQTVLKDVQAHNVSATPPENHNMWFHPYMFLYLLSFLYILIDSYFVQSAVSHLYLNQWGCLKLYLPFPVCLNCRWVFRIVVLFFRFVLVFSDLLFCFEFVIVFYDLLCFVNCCCVFWFFVFFFWFAFAFVICYFVFRIGICLHFSATIAFRAQSANHLIMFGTSERKAQSFDSVRDFRAQSACVCMYILYMRYQNGQICLLKHVSKYI